jgi:hypothetical protein
MIAYLTDVEGRWDRLVSYCDGNPAVNLTRGELRLAPGARFVYGGDVPDRGPSSRRLARTLVEARLRYGDRVILLAGNRDINKLRLPRELGGCPPERAPRDAPGADLLRWILAHTMGAREAFEHRRSELVEEEGPGDDEAVVRSFLDDVQPDGITRRYLDEARLAWRSDDALFVHGGIPARAFLTVPGAPDASGVDAWIDSLNRWYHSQLGAFDRDPTPTASVPEWWSLIAYQMPRLPERNNDESIVYGRNTGHGNNPVLPPEPVREGLRAAGVRRLVVGHTPNGDFPSIVTGEDGFSLIVADASYPRTATCPQVLLDGERTLVRGRVLLEDGRELAAEAELPADDAVGRRDADGWLCKARLETGERLWFRFEEGTTYRQVARGR